MSSDTPVQTAKSEINRAEAYKLSINAALGAIFFGYVMGVFNPLQAYIEAHVYPDISDTVLFMMTSLVPLGAAIGSVIAGKIAAEDGRRYLMIVCDIWSIIGSVLTLIYGEYYMLIGRLICGFCVGLNSSVVPLYINEVSPVEIKGETGTFFQVFICLGVLLSYVFGLGIPIQDDENQHWWRVMLAFPILISGVRLFNLLIYFTQESPKYSVLKGENEDAKLFLGDIYDEQRANQEFEILRKQKEEETTNGVVKYGDLTGPIYRKRLTIGVLLAMIQQFVGINAIIFYSTKIFAEGLEEDDDEISAIQFTVGVGVVNLLSSLLATAIIGSQGRRRLLLAGTTVVVATLVALAFIDNSSLTAKVLIYLYIFGFSLSLGTIVWIYISEILPDIGVGVATMMNWISCILIAQLFPMFADKYGTNNVFLGFAIFGFLGLIFIYIYVKETKGKNTLEISRMYGEDHVDSEETEKLKV